ncbi:TfoX/Sxy family protein [Tessaracoccus antarcticus]|uniref:TfoX family protein n=1 Tax=Tessaracoccus antarcticus TaxID=2479848 RepID=A0A3M0GA85_9ACTN|nr:TfoX/Sxy family protein [Tessaracoccus antarcticus]RMB61915.1 TfoX family protein [Tessaracoccus antarcticus]
MTMGNSDVVERIRDALHTGRTVREVRMFGGQCFMVDEKLLLGVMKDGALLVRTNPENGDDLLAVDGAKQAEMGAGRSMGPSWVSVAPEAVATEEALQFWMDEALAYNATITDR